MKKREHIGFIPMFTCRLLAKETPDGISFELETEDMSVTAKQRIDEKLKNRRTAFDVVDTNGNTRHMNAKEKD